VKSAAFGKRPKQVKTAVEEVEIPPTRIPEKYHVADQSPIRPHGAEVRSLSLLAKHPFLLESVKIGAIWRGRGFFFLKVPMRVRNAKK